MGFAVCLLLVFNLFYTVMTSLSIMSYDPSITFFDGSSQWEKCDPSIGRTITGKSGVLVSHYHYGIIPYNNDSKNCVLMIAAPLGYQIRLRMLDFNVPGVPGICDKDSLHVMDHESPIDPAKLAETTDSQRTPGPIIGNLCGSLSNNSQVIVSQQNCLTIWWHTDGSVTGKKPDSGFRVLWSAFRKPTFDDPCTEDEFQCASNECIPSALACNRFSDCDDGSDMERRRQIAHQCKNIATDLFSELNGPKKVLLCFGIVIVGLVVVGAVCSIVSCLLPDCLKGHQKSANPKGAELMPNAESRTHVEAHLLAHDQQRPPLPTVSPPSKAPPNVFMAHHHPMYSRQMNIPQQQYFAHHSGTPTTNNDQVTNTTTTATTKSSSGMQSNNMHMTLEDYHRNNMPQQRMLHGANHYHALSGCDSSYILPPPPATPAQSDYTYIRTEAGRIIL
uniref:CUB domain-containing protein n=1 Tax=Panagrellus redivivus TaxID=6233 RepID=A0A7E4W390_PANRE